MSLVQDNPVPKKQLQLVGVTAMFIASKYEEMYPPEIADFAFVTDRAYTTALIREMEMKILRVLNFGFGRPLPLQFLRRASKIGDVSWFTHIVSEVLLLCSNCVILIGFVFAGYCRASHVGQVLPGAYHG